MLSFDILEENSKKKKDDDTFKRIKEEAKERVEYFKEPIGDILRRYKTIKKYAYIRILFIKKQIFFLIIQLVCGRIVKY